jgi:hypothetical protein
MMETVSEASARLRAAGYDMDFTPTADGHLRCGACGTDHDPSTVSIDELVRYEGISDPEDEAMLLALTCDCGRRGLYVTAFGPSASAEDVAVLQRLP